jgi:hypothetical protein
VRRLKHINASSHIFLGCVCATGWLSQKMRGKARGYTFEFLAVRQA